MNGKDIIESVKKDKSLDVYQKSELMYELANKSLDELFKDDDSNKNLDQITKEIKNIKNITFKGFMLYHKKIDDVFKSKKYFSMYNNFETYVIEEFRISYSSYLEQRSVYYAMLDFPDLRSIVSQGLFEYSKIIPAIPLLNNKEIPAAEKKQIIKDLVGSMSEKNLKQMKEWAAEQKEKWQKSYDDVIKRKQEMVAKLSVSFTTEKTQAQINAEQMLFGENAVRLSKRHITLEYMDAFITQLNTLFLPDLGPVENLENETQKNELFDKVQMAELKLDDIRRKLYSVKKFIA